MGEYTMNLRKVKVLPLERWMCYMGKADPCNPKLTETDPIFNRPGYYLYDNKCWFETKEKAYLYEVNTFKFELALLEASKYNHRQINALKGVIQQKLATKKQKELYYLIRAYYDGKDAGRSAKRIYIRMKNKRI